MRVFLRFLAVAVLAVLFASPLQAAPTCVSVCSLTVVCNGFDQQGRTKLNVSFTLCNVKPGTSFVRIHEGVGDLGGTFTYPFKTPTQTFAATEYWYSGWPPIQGGYKCFYIDVYQVAANGKVSMCREQYCAYMPWCGYPPGFFKEANEDVVAGELPPVATMSVAPNPATDVVNVTVGVPSYDPASSIEIVDMSGNVVAVLAKGMAAGTTVIPADLPNVANGMYMVRLMHAAGMQIQPLQIVR